eukprot:Tbor_TRINITY_DN3100_c0_g1::TRINITY_DN3100_c0_g1_i1::g.14734::m.14734/K01412/PMPCA, MAS2; mitochondrial-processing peptidase subunit alpha
MLRHTSVKNIAQFNFGHPPLTKSFDPRAPVKPSLVNPAANSGVKKTTLSNGVTVVSHDLGGAQTTVGFYVKAGAKFDPMGAPGLSYVMRFAIQTSNMDNSLFQLDRIMRSNGQSYGHGEVRKENIYWKAEGRRDMWMKPFETLGTCVSAPRFHEADVERFRDTMDNQLEEMRWRNPREYCIDQLESFAFYKEPLGQPRHVWATSNDKANHKTMLDHWCAYFRPNRVSVAAVNINHEELVAAYTDLPFPHSETAPHHARAHAVLETPKDETIQYYPRREYVEIEDRAKAMCTRPGMEAEIITAMGWCTAGRDGDIKKYAAAAVAYEALAAQFCDGIMYDRTETHTGVRAFYRPYTSAGLVGFTVRGSTAQNVKDQVLKAAEKIANLKLDDKMIVYARNRSYVRMCSEELDRTTDYADFLSTSKYTSEELQKAFNEVTPAAVNAEIDVFRKRGPTMFVTGDAYEFPSLRQLGFP